MPNPSFCYRLKLMPCGTHLQVEHNALPPPRLSENSIWGHFPA